MVFIFVMNCQLDQDDGVTIEQILYFPEKTESIQPNYYDEAYLKELDIKNKKSEYKLFLVGYAYSSNRDAYYSVYRSSFLDENNEFVKGTEKNIEDFLVYEKVMSIGLEKFYKELEELEKIVKKEPKLVEIDTYGQDWINVLREERAKIKEIKNYYETGEYKKDNYSKGKSLNDEYLKILQKRKQAFRKLNKKIKIEEYNDEKNIVSNSKFSDNLYINLRKLNLLIKIFNDRLYDWNEVPIGKNEKFIDIKNQGRYRAELEKILTEIEKQLNKTKELGTDDRIDSMRLRKDVYLKILEQGDESVKLSKEILNRIKNKNYGNLNELGNYSVVNEFEMFQNIRENILKKE